MGILDAIRSRMAPPQPAGPPRQIATFTTDDQPISIDGVSLDDGGWKIVTGEARTVQLFQIADPGIEQCIVTFRAMMRSENVTKHAYLEMWCRFTGQGEFFSKGFNNVVSGTTNWASYEIPFYLKQGQRPDLVRLNVHFDGPGTLWIKDIELLATPLQ